MAKSYFSNYGKPWSRKENQFLRKHYRKMNATKIGDRLGRTRGSVMGQASVLGIAKPKRTKWQIEVDTMLENGYTDKEIAKVTKIDLRVIKRWRKENDLYGD